MNGLGDAVERKLAAQESEKRDGELRAARRDLELRNALAQLQSSLQDLAAFLATKLTPQPIVIGKGTGWFSRDRTAPAFVWADDSGPHSRTFIALLATGQVWKHFSSYGSQGHGHFQDLGKELETRLELFGHFFAVDYVSGLLTVSPSYGKEDSPLPPVPLDDAIASIAAGFITRNR